MMQPPEPTLAELGRTLDRIEREFGRRLDEMKEAFQTSVKAEVYEAHRQVMAAAIADAVDDIAALRAGLEKERSERRADRRVIIGAVLAIVGAAILATLGIK